MASKKSRKKVVAIRNGDIGKSCRLKALTLYHGREPYDLPWFVIVGKTDNTHFLITDNGLRKFIVGHADILIN